MKNKKNLLFSCRNARDKFADQLQCQFKIEVEVTLHAVEILLYGLFFS